MADRTCRAVGLDVHGFIFERGHVDPQDPPETLIMQQREQIAACYRTAIREVLDDGFDFVIDPNALWEMEQRAFEQVHNTRTSQRSPQGRSVTQRHLIEAVNAATIVKLFPRVASMAGQQRLLRVAKRVRALRRTQRMNGTYVLNEDIANLLRWLRTSTDASLPLLTGLERRQLTRLIREHVPADLQETLMAHHCCAADLGGNKLSNRYWYAVLQRYHLEPHDLVVVGNSVTIDAACTEVGIPAIIFDRGGMRRTYYLGANGDRGSRYGIPYVHFDDPLPPRRAFIGFAESTDELRRWLERMTLPRATLERIAV